jgi:hypothetical protein
MQPLASTRSRELDVQPLFISALLKIFGRMLPPVFDHSFRLPPAPIDVQTKLTENGSEGLQHHIYGNVEKFWGFC